MAKIKLRKIQIDQETYLWKRTHLHVTADGHTECIEKVVIYLEGHKKSPLQLSFKDGDNLKIKTDPQKEKWCIGYPEDGVIWLYKLPGHIPDSNDQQQEIVINLNRPAVIAALIRYFRQTGWQPKESTQAYIIEDALKLLGKIVLPNGIN